MTILNLVNTVSHTETASPNTPWEEKDNISQLKTDLVSVGAS